MIFMNCLNHNCKIDDIEENDNFCHECGHWTAKGFTFLKGQENVNAINSGSVAKQNSNLSLLASLLVVQ